MEKFFSIFKFAKVEIEFAIENLILRNVQVQQPNEPSSRRLSSVLFDFFNPQMRYGQNVYKQERKFKSHLHFFPSGLHQLSSVDIKRIYSTREMVI